MSECSRAVGKGTVMYKCRVQPDGHDGPCAAPELGRSTIERQAWLAQQAITVEPAAAAVADRIEREVTLAPAPPVLSIVTEQSPSLSSSPTPTEAPIGAVQLGSFTDFESSARELMNREDLTPALNNWLTGTAAQIALNHLWRQASGAFEAGCVSITMTRDELERFIPERLRPT